MLTLSELYNNLNQAETDQNLTLTASLVDSPNLVTFFNDFPNKELELEGVTITQDDQTDPTTVTVTGNVNGSWSIPGLNNQILSSIAITLVFTSIDSNTPLNANLTCTANLIIDGQLIPVSGQLSEENLLGFSLNPENSTSPQTVVTLSLAALASYVSNNSMADFLPQGASLFDSVAITGIGLQFGFASDAQTLVSIGAAATGTWELITSAVTLKEIGVTVSATYSPFGDGQYSPSFGGAVDATTTIGQQDYQIVLYLSNSEIWQFTIQPNDSNVLPVLDDIANLVGGSALSTSVQQGLTDLKMSSIAVETVDILLNLAAKTITSATIGGRITVDNIGFDITVNLPDFQFYGALTQGRTLDLKSLATNIFDDAQTFPQVDVTDLSIMALPSAGQYEFITTVESDWQLSVGGAPIDFKSFQLEIDKTKDSTTGDIEATIDISGVSLDVFAGVPESGEGWVFTGETGTDENIKLKDFMAGLLKLFDVTLPSSVPDVVLKNMYINFNTLTKAFQFKGDTLVEIEVPFIADSDNTISASADLQFLTDSATGKHTMVGFMEGDLIIGASQFTLQYAMAQDAHDFVASWESSSDSDLLGLNTLFAAFGISSNIAQEAAIPDSLDLNLKKVFFEYKADSQTINLVADSVNYGEFYLIASKLQLGNPDPDNPPPADSSSTWNYVFGWAFNQTDLTQMPGVGSAFTGSDIFHLSEASVVVSSGAIKSFTIPTMPAFGTVTKGVNYSTQSSSDSEVQPVGQGASVELQKGIAVVAKMDLDASQQNTKMQALKTVISQTELVITAEYVSGQSEFTITALLDGSVSIPTGGSSDLEIRNSGLLFIFSDGITFELYGDLTLHFDDQIIDVEPKLSINTEEIDFSVDVDFENGWQEPMGIEGLTLDEVAFEMGVTLLPASGVNLGLEGKSHITNQPKASDDFAFVCEIIDIVPDPLLLSFYMAELDIQTAMAVLVPGADTSEIPNFLKQIKITDLSLYWAESVVVMPDGTIAQPGFRFNGNLEILSFKAHAAVAVDQTVGFQGDFETSPIHIGNVLSVTGNGQGIYKRLGGKDGNDSTKPLYTTVRPNKTALETDVTEIIPAGGPVLKFQTKQSPYLYASVIVDFLDLEHLEVEALVQDSGILFKVEYDISDLEKAELDFTLNKEQFSLYSQFGLHIKGDIGPIKILDIDFGTLHIDAGFDLEMTLSATKDLFDMRINGDFEFEGARLTLPELHISIVPSSLKQLPETILQHIEDNADEIFKDLFDDASKLVSEATEEIEQLADEGVQEVKKIADDAVTEAKQVVDDAEKVIDTAVDDLSKDIDAIKEETAHIEQAAAAEVSQLANDAEAEVAKIGDEIASVVDAADHEVRQIANQIADEAKAVAAEIDKLAQQTEEEVEAIAADIAQEVKKILSDAQAVADDIIKSAQAAVDAIEKEAEKLWSDAKALADAIAEAAKKVETSVSNTAKSVWHAVSKY